MKLKVAIKDWSGQTGDRQSRHKLMFEQAGAEVVDVDNGNPHFVWTPIPGMDNDVTCPMITQLGGFGSNYLLPSTPKPSPAFEQTFINSDIVSTIDPIMYHVLDKRHEGMKVVPLPSPHKFAEGIENVDDGKFNVLNPMGSMEFKKPEEFVEGVKIVGEENSDIHFYLVQKGKHTLQFPTEWLDLDNLTILPQMPMEELKKYYGLADVIAPWSAAETGPNTAFEGFALGLPVVTRMMGLTLTVSHEHLPDMIDDFGMGVRDFDDKWKSRYGSGDGEHYVQAETVDEFVDTILHLYNNQGKQWKGKEWIDKWWDLEDRGECYLDLFREF